MRHGAMIRMRHNVRVKRSMRHITMGTVGVILGELLEIRRTNPEAREGSHAE